MYVFIYIYADRRIRRGGQTARAVRCDVLHQKWLCVCVWVGGGGRGGMGVGG